MKYMSETPYETDQRIRDEAERTAAKILAGYKRNEVGESEIALAVKLLEEEGFDLLAANAGVLRAKKKLPE